MDSVIEVVKPDEESHAELLRPDDSVAIELDEEQDPPVIDEEVKQLVDDGQQQVISLGEQMQIMCDLYGFRQDTYWDCYRSDQRDALRNKLSLIVSHEFVTEKNLVLRWPDTM